MFTVISLMLAGMLAGYILRDKKISSINKIISILIWLLLFILGIEVGSNRQLISGLATIGVEAVIITVAAVAGSCTAAWLLWYALYKRKKGKEA